MGGRGRGGRQRDGATKEMGEERHERMGADRPSLWGILLFTDRGPLDTFGGLRLGVAPTAGDGGERQWGDHPTQKLPRLPGEVAALTTGRGSGAAGASHHVSQTGAGVVT